MGNGAHGNTTLLIEERWLSQVSEVATALLEYIQQICKLIVTVKLCM